MVSCGYISTIAYKLQSCTSKINQTVQNERVTKKSTSRKHMKANHTMPSFVKETQKFFILVGIGVTPRKWFVGGIQKVRLSWKGGGKSLKSERKRTGGGGSGLFMRSLCEKIAWVFKQSAFWQVVFVSYDPFIVAIFNL